MPAAGNGPQAGLQFPSDPGGGILDEAFIRYFQSVGETTKLMIGVANDADDTIGLFQFGAERMTIFNGNIGIGTASPVSDLHIRKDATSAVGPILTLMNGAGGNGAGGAIDFDGYDPATKTPPGNFPTARIQSLDDGNFSSHLAFLTKPPGANDNALVERLRITNDGALRSPKWNVIQLLSAFSQATGLPITRIFTTGGGTLLIFASGSGFGAGAIGMEILVDGVVRGQASSFTNEPSSHKAFVANTLVVPGIPNGLHNITFRAIPGTTTTTNNDDRFSLTILELPF